MKTAHVYVRVSTDGQDTANQLTGIAAFILERQFATGEIIHDTASTKTAWQERKIAPLLASAGPGDWIIVSEVSRLARSTLECLEIFKEAAANGITIHAVKNGLAMDGSMQAKIVSTVLSMAAEIERDMIRARTTESLQRRRAQGLPLGRPEGATSRSKIAGKAGQIAELDRAGVADAAIARVLGVSRGTLARFRSKQEAND